MNNLANELRPKTLDDIIGQKQVVDLLKKVAKDRIHSRLYFLWRVRNW
nr:hypothetical protein [Mycoplasmopsis bovis]